MGATRISLKAARINAGLTQQQLADVLHVNVNTIVGWEKGSSEPRLSQLQKISELSGIPMDNIFSPSESA